jgi:hypothetical protein
MSTVNAYRHHSGVDPNAEAQVNTWKVRIIHLSEHSD